MGTSENKTMVQVSGTILANHGLPTSLGPHGGRHAGRGRRGRCEPVQIPGPVGRGGDGAWRGSMWSFGSAGECAVQPGAVRSDSIVILWLLIMANGE